MSFPTWLCPVYLPNIPGFYTILFFTTSDFTFTTRHIHSWATFPLRSASSFFLELFLCSSPEAFGHLSTLGAHSSVISFCLLIVFIKFSRQEYWSSLPSPSPVGHILSELSTMTCPSSVALQDVTHSLLELHKAETHVIILVSFLWLWFSFSWLWDYKSCFLMGGTGCGENWVLLWLAEPCLVNL